MGYTKAILKDYLADDGTQQIIIEYRHPGVPRRLRFPTRFRINKKEWNKSLGISLHDDSLNDYLQIEKEKIEGVKKSLIEKGKEPTCKNVLKGLEQLAVKEQEQQVEEETVETLLQRPFREWYELHLSTIRNKDTKRAQQNTMNRLMEYDPEVTLDQLNYDFIKGFTQFLEDNEYRNNTIHRHKKGIGFVLNTIRKYCRKYRGIKLLIQDIKEDLKDVKVIEKYDDPHGLDYQMFLDLLHFNVFPPNKRHLSKLRDLFILGICIGGLRIEDFLALQQDKIRKVVTMEGTKVWLADYYESKNKKYHKDVPLLPYAYDILEENSGKIPDRICGAVFNRELKELGAILGWTHDVEIKDYDLNGNLKKIRHERFCDIMSSKMMRKTRVTIDEYLDIDESISRMATGHDSKARDRYNVRTVMTMLKGNEKHFEAYEQQKNQRLG